MMSFLRLSRLITAAAVFIALSGPAGGPWTGPHGSWALGAQQGVYTVFTSDGRRTLPYRSVGGADMVALDQLAGPFALTVAEDNVLRGLVISTRGERILAIPGQSFVQVAGKVISLSAPIQREKNAWLVPIDFLSQAVGPATGTRVVVRRPSHLVIVGDVRVPQISGSFERTDATARLVLEILPATAHRITRDGNRLTIRFDAAALDAEPVTGLVPEFISAFRADGPSLILELGPSAATYRTEDETTRLTIELLPPGPPPAPAPATPAAPLPTIDPTPGLRTVVIDPGHGGEDEGVTSAGGTSEKNLALQVARRLKSGIESRMGLRVLLTRDGDENVPIDRRTSLANNNKADLFISLHANASFRSDVRGAQVLALSSGDYAAEPGADTSPGLPVPMVGGGTRLVKAVPWDLAQLPVAERSSSIAAVLVRHLTERGVLLYTRPAAQLPLRVLVGANMPAVMLEMGFLTNGEDERALTGAGAEAVVEALLATIAEVRRGGPAGDDGRSAR
jgi:N-acetylmuramoyl-L-alanine amidase